MLRCKKHDIPPRRTITSSGKVIWLCRYSLRARFRLHCLPAFCPKCKEPGVYSEGLCYPCWYYRYL
jgi:hypothetical protein